MQWDAFLDQELLTNLAIVTGVTLTIYLVLTSALRIISSRLYAKASHSHSRFYRIAAKMLKHTSRLLVLAFAILMSLKVVDLGPRWEAIMAHGWFIALAFQIALWLDMGVRMWTDSLTRDGKTRNPVTTTIFGIMIRMVVWTMMLLSILANLGVNITALVASLGVGGIAIALAVQTLLSDIFASMSIGIDKPFEIGDFVVFDDVAGNIEHIGLKTTRIRSLSGEQIVCGNSQLLARTLHNYKRMNTRRIVFTFGISYDTPAAKITEVSALVRRVIEKVEKTHFDRAHFLSFSESQLTFEVVHIVQTSDYNLYMDIQQEINLGLLEGMRELDVRFAFPRRSVEFNGGQIPEIKVAGVAGNSGGGATRGDISGN
ncbi:mechanosensitive ion channel family protein [Halopseudomonas salina]|uniref:Mechanosensitive ion channel protein MscS n=1 Tax=Halopseudomonas salina TaxID=1323744 RepID=A0ABQ1Q2R0_9GAMM|nr:mechanosensitive ion channel family protein [Halopseudomonas salina]GGD11694.1 mechanosensitive ion channel protein MscS [Halopseudomonas salina]